MACCDCCCPEGEECCKAPGESGICCTPEKCCGTSESPECCGEFSQCCNETCCAETVLCCGEPGDEVCCLEGQYCCDGACQDEPCEEGCSGSCDEENPCPEGCYCCDGVCLDEPEVCQCPNICGYVVTSSISELGTTATATLEPDTCDSPDCKGEEIVNTPGDCEDAVTCEVNAAANTEANVFPCSAFACGRMGFVESYEYDEDTTTRTYTRSLDIQVSISCAVEDGATKWRVHGSWGLQQQEFTYLKSSPTTLVKRRELSESGFISAEDAVVALESCGNAPSITMVVDEDGITVNGELIPWDGADASNTCTEYPGGTPTDCMDYLSADYPSPGTMSLTWSGDCPSPCEAEAP